ncbi:hypothetical protein Goshw_015183 [Gossypium schwendimanii]|uniref:Uncharacterized protein n=1 Tax=Gossypium schwendimanii TaxID=34291 RepID=A0A7J9LNI1_GOSSC|nr:hypothetical protein [Gossypium schwendimanii]
MGFQQREEENFYESWMLVELWQRGKAGAQEQFSESHCRGNGNEGIMWGIEQGPDADLIEDVLLLVMGIMDDYIGNDDISC